MNLDLVSRDLPPQIQRISSFTVANWVMPAITVAAIAAITAIGHHYYLNEPKTYCNLASDYNVTMISNHSEICKPVDLITEIKNVPMTTLENIISRFELYGNRTLIEKLNQDNYEVQRLGTQHTELADHLDNLLQTALKHRSKTFNRIYSLNIHIQKSKIKEELDKNGIDLSFDYNPQDLEGSTIGKCAGKLTFSLPIEEIESKIGNVPYFTPRAYNIFNDSIFPYKNTFMIEHENGREFLLSPERIDLIRKYGFYDASSPTDIAALFTRHSVEKVSTITDHDVNEINHSLLNIGCSGENSLRLQKIRGEFVILDGKIPENFCF